MKDIKEKIKKNVTEIIFILILILAIFIRLYKLDLIPWGIHVDEAGMAYDAFCIANYGTDRYLNQYPVYLINFGGGQSALYAYLASILIKVFGFNIFTIRLPAVIMGVTAIVSSYFIVKKYCGKKFALTFMALFTICPWHIMSSRWGLDCNLLAPMSIISICLLVTAKNNIQYFIAGISIGLTLYSYALSYIIIPIFLISSIIYMLYTKKITLKNIIIMGIPIFLLALPLILMLCVNKGYISEIKSIITIPKLWSYRENEINILNIFKNIKFFKTLFTNDFLVYNALPEFGTLYWFTSFFSIIGFGIEVKNLINNIKNKKFTINSIMLFLFISVIICMLIIKGPNINKANAAFIPLIFFACTTLKYIYQKYKVFFVFFIVLYAIYFIFFINFYFNEYTNRYKYQPYFEQDLIEMLEYANDNFADKEVYIYTNLGQPYIYTLFNDRISPYDFNESLHNDGGYRFAYGKYYFNTNKIVENAIYIVKNNEKLIKKLRDMNFKIEQKNSYIFAYK